MQISNLDGKVCLVTGGSRTLGAAIVRQMAREGAQVAINYFQSGAEALNLCRELGNLGVNAHLIQADVTHQDQVSRLVSETLAHFGRIDILVNNVGPYVDTPFLGLETNDFDAVLAGNLRSTFLMSQYVGNVMKEQGYGKIINIAASDFKNRSHSVYGLAKEGVIYLTESFALELAPEVCIYAVAPDLIADNEDMQPELVSQAIGATPMGRLVTRDEVARVVCLLCTSPFTMATGQTIILDGGRNIPRKANGSVDPGDG
ncbi:MAG: SDR family oxidoreductase [Anaerolineales bacterium]|nr:SDR family oxidoreductase [Anaerolineales bacterium]